MRIRTLFIPLCLLAILATACQAPASGGAAGGNNRYEKATPQGR